MTAHLPRILCAAIAIAAVSAFPACKREEGGGGASSGPGGGPAAFRVAAASDLAFAFKDVAAAFERRTGHRATFTFGSTGQLAKQISEGAPYDVFAAANVSFVDEVVEAEACDPATKAMYARGRIVVWTRQGDGVAAPATLAELADARFAKIAIANPEHAPYGRAAKEALETAGLWDRIQPKIVYGGNVQQTLQLAQTGNVEAAIVALSLAIVTEGGRHFVVDDKLHRAIDQALVVCKRGGSAAAGAQFATFVNSPEGREIMKRYGFLLPGETVAKAAAP